MQHTKYISSIATKLGDYSPQTEIEIGMLSIIEKITIPVAGWGCGHKIKTSVIDEAKPVTKAGD